MCLQISRKSRTSATLSKHSSHLSTRFNLKLFLVQLSEAVQGHKQLWCFVLAFLLLFSSAAQIINIHVAMNLDLDSNDVIPLAWERVFHSTCFYPPSL